MGPKALIRGQGGRAGPDIRAGHGVKGLVLLLILDPPPHGLDLGLDLGRGLAPLLLVLLLAPVLLHLGAPD